MKRIIQLALAIFITTAFTACVRPVEPKDIKQIQSNQTLYVIPYQGENISRQVKFDSAQYEKYKKVAVREYQVPKYWLNRGRFEWTEDGEWRDAEKLIIVDRSPVNVEFKVDEKGKNAKEDRDAIWIESADSIGFSMGFSLTAYIEESDTSTYLYRYSENALRSTVMSEVRARIQSAAAEFAAQYKLDILRSKKNELVEHVKNQVVPYFKERGITITTLGILNGMTYDNPKIQEAIDGVFVTQQEKERAAAQLAAQADKNARSESEAQQEKKNAITVAEGLAAAAIQKATGEAAAIKMVSEAAASAASNPVFIELRKLEVESKKYERWNGALPTTVTNLTGTEHAPMGIILK